MEKNLLTVAILEGMENADQCPLCYLWVKDEKRQMRYLLTNETIMSPEFREKILAAKGFCNRHMYLLYETYHKGHTEDGVGYALYMQGVVERIVDRLKSLPLDDLRKLEVIKNNNILARRKQQRRAFTELSKAVADAVQGQQPCPACQSLGAMGRIHLHTLVQMLDNNEFAEKFKSSKGLCLPHFLAAIQMLAKVNSQKPSRVGQILLEVEIEQLQLVGHYLSEFVRKHSWDVRHEPPGPEVGANFTALNMLVGVEGLHCGDYKPLSS